MYANPPEGIPELPPVPALRPGPDLDRCRHGRGAGEHCPDCDDDDGPTPVLAPVGFLPVNPKALEISGVLLRCQLCGSLIVDLDRCLHSEHHAAA